MKRELVAQVAHEINRAYCASMGDESQVAWADAPDWQKASALAGVDMHMANPDATPEQSHESWLAQKTAEGWSYGKVKDVAAKTHPCFLPYADLPAEQRAKDYLFRGAVHALKAISDNTVVVIDASTLPIKYVGKRATHIDVMYATRIFWSEPGESRLVPKDKALQMLKHTDVYAMGEQTGETQSSAAIEPKVDEKAEVLQQTLDSIASMRKPGVVSFLKTNFNVESSEGAKVDELRVQATNLVHQFGAP